MDAMSANTSPDIIICPPQGVSKTDLATRITWMGIVHASKSKCQAENFSGLIHELSTGAALLTWDCQNGSRKACYKYNTLPPYILRLVLALVDTCSAKPV